MHPAGIVVEREQVEFVMLIDALELKVLEGFPLEKAKLRD
jgi:hypothetical protein